VALDRGVYLEKFGRWRGLFNRIAVGSFRIQAESYSVGTVWPELVNGSSKLQTERDRELKVKFVVNKITRTIDHPVSNYLVQSNVQILCNYTRGI
jgi:hypothetical protein